MTLSPREQALARQRAYAQSIDAIRSDERLSRVGRRRAMAAAFLKAEEELRHLKQSEHEATTRRRRELERDLFGAGSRRANTATASYRDAEDRAQQLKRPEQALALLSRAERNGDALLARAIAARAWDRTWTPVLDAYAAERPGVLEQLRELDALERSLDGSVIGRVSASMAFRVRKPEELRDVYSELALRNLADG